jgi:hypothetical protein
VNTTKFWVMDGKLLDEEGNYQLHKMDSIPCSYNRQNIMERT